MGAISLLPGRNVLGRLDGKLPPFMAHYVRLPHAPSSGRPSEYSEVDEHATGVVGTTELLLLPSAAVCH